MVMGLGGRMVVMTGDHKLVYYLVPKEWDSVGPDMQQLPRLTSLKRASKGSFWATIRFLAVRFGAVGCTIGHGRF